MFADKRRIIVGLRSHFRPMSEGGKSGWVGSDPERDGSDRVGKNGPVDNSAYTVK